MRFRLGEISARLHLLARAWRTRRALYTLFVLGAGALCTGLFSQLSERTFAGNSDGATVVLEGHAISSGHLFLSGWSMTVESFWTVDALLYAIAIRLDGVKPDLLHLVPAAIAAAVLLVCMWLARQDHHGAPAVLGALTVFAVLGLPGSTLSYLLLQGPWHVGTTLWCLLAFVSICRRRSVASFFLGAVLLAAGLLGDAMTVTIGLLPIMVWSVIEIRQGHWRSSGKRGLLVVPASIALALAVRSLAIWVGSFSFVNRNLPVRLAQMEWNVRHLPALAGAMFGFGSLPLGVEPGSAVTQWARLIVALFVGFSVLVSTGELVVALVRRVDDHAKKRRSLDRLLVLATIFDGLTFVAASPSNNANYERYLLPGVIFATLLAGRLASRCWVRVANRRTTLAMATFLAALFALLGLNVAGIAASPPAPQPAAKLASFLERHGFLQGIGDYWSSSLVTVESDDQVTVRPVSNTKSGALVRYDRQSSASWYEGTTFQFFVYDTARPWRKVDTNTAIKSFGAPAKTYAVGTYRVLTWSHPLQISPELPPPPPLLRLFFRL